jgi:hypothetical protein
MVAAVDRQDGAKQQVWNGTAMGQNQEIACRKSFKRLKVECVIYTIGMNFPVMRIA